MAFSDFNPKTGGGLATAAGGTIIGPVPANRAWVLTSLFASNVDTGMGAEAHTITLKRGSSGRNLCPINRPISVAGGPDFAEGRRVVLLEGDEVWAQADADSVIEVDISYIELELTP